MQVINVQAKGRYVITFHNSSIIVCVCMCVCIYVCLFRVTQIDTTKYFWYACNEFPNITTCGLPPDFRNQNCCALFFGAANRLILESQSSEYLHDVKHICSFTLQVCE